MKLQAWAHGAEIVASFAMVVTLVFLILEVEGNTRALEWRADLDRASALNTSFFSSPRLSSVLAKIKAVDGTDPLPRALTERYGLTPEEAVLWERHLWLIWLGHEADFGRRGWSEELAAWVGGTLETPDNRLYWEIKGPDSDPGFRAHVDPLAEARR